MLFLWYPTKATVCHLFPKRGLSRGKGQILDVYSCPARESGYCKSGRVELFWYVLGIASCCSVCHHFLRCHCDMTSMMLFILYATSNCYAAAAASSYEGRLCSVNRTRAAGFMLSDSRHTLAHPVPKSIFSYFFSSNVALSPV